MRNISGLSDNGIVSPFLGSHRSGGEGYGEPEPPTGYALVVDENGNYLRGPDGRYLIY